VIETPPGNDTVNPSDDSGPGTTDTLAKPGDDTGCSGNDASGSVSFMRQ